MGFWIDNRDTIFLIVFASFGVILVAFSNMLLTSKKQILKAFDVFQQDKPITKKELDYFSMSLFDFLYMITPLPFKKLHPDFYQIPIIEKRVKEYRQSRKYFLLFILVYTILIVGSVLINIKAHS